MGSKDAQSESKSRNPESTNHPIYFSIAELSCTTRIKEAQEIPLFLYAAGRRRGRCGSLLRLQFLREMFLRTSKHPIMSHEVGSMSRARARRTQ